MSATEWYEYHVPAPSRVSGRFDLGRVTSFYAYKPENYTDGTTVVVDGLHIRIATQYYDFCKVMNSYAGKEVPRPTTNPKPAP